MARLLALLLSMLLLAGGVGSAVSPVPQATPRGGMLLVASDTMGDGYFAQTVLLLLEADAGGALALILNRPLTASLREAMPELSPRASDVRLHAGGPVQRGNVTLLLRTEQDAPALVTVLPGVKASFSLVALQALMNGVPEVEEARAYLGYAGWSPGQLQGELARGDWHLLTTDAAEIFDTPAERMWPRLRRRAAGVWALLPGAP